MKPFVNDLVTNEEVTTFFFVSDVPQIRKSKKDKDYLCIKLSDKTGEIDARVWDIPPGLDVTSLKKGMFVKVRAQVGEWNEQQQLSVSQIRKWDGTEDLDPGDFFERSERDPEDMWKELGFLLSDYVGNGPISGLIEIILQENERAFKAAPAAKRLHHNFIGGLLEHVLSLCHGAVNLSKQYDLNIEIMLATCILHDIGKIQELNYELGISFSVEGTLLGHISIGMDMVSDAIRRIPDFPPKLRMVLLHMIASHHGLLEWGSPKVPLMREAIAFHLLDMVDSRMAICNRVLKGAISEEGLTEWVKEFGGPLYKLEVG